jgi:hypothetical protein
VKYKVLFLMVFIVIAMSQVANADTSANLFFVKRNKNVNEVHYDAKIENCEWLQPEVDYYWRELTAGSKVIEEIKPWEVIAYGFDIERSNKEEIKIRLKAIPKKVITSRLSKNGSSCDITTTVDIGGKTAKLRSIYVYATENFIGFPSVQYIEILGYLNDGQAVYEQLPQSAQIKNTTLPQPDGSRWKSGVTTWGRN